MTDRTAGRRPVPHRTFWLRTCLGAALALALVPGAAQGQAGSGAIHEAMRQADGGDRELRAFYRARNHRPLWIRDGALGPEADALLRLLQTADADGLDPRSYRERELAAAVEAARDGTPRALARAEMLLSRRFAAYVRDVRRTRPTGMVYADEALKPVVPAARAALDAAAAAPSLERYIETIGWMNPIYGELREALAALGSGSEQSAITIPPGPTLRAGTQGERVRLLRLRLGLDAEGGFDGALGRALRAFQSARGLPVDGIAGTRTIAALNGGSGEERRLLRINLERARALPAHLGRRYVLVDAAAARLWLYEDGRVRDTMRVVVGQPSLQTPMMAGTIRYVTLNPYWNVPPDLVRDRIARNVLDRGPSYLRERGYELLSDWTASATPLAPADIDWQAVASGRRELRVRQLPGGANAMGSMKFMFPNDLGIYLHDTPDKNLLREDVRQFSAGCVRVEDAPRLARWLFGRTVRPAGDAPEQQVDLADPVPVYITYLTAVPEGGRIAYRPDLYDRDGEQMARLGLGGTTASR